MTLKPTKTIRWIIRDNQIVMQQWYENPIVPTLDQLKAVAEPWTVGQFRDTIIPVVSEET